MLILFWLLSPVPEEGMEHVWSASLFACFRDKELSGLFKYYVSYII